MSRWPLALASAAVLGPGCVCGGSAADPPIDADAEPPWRVGIEPEQRRQGMAWIPPGVLVAGTPVDRLPRVADEELPGVPTELAGFFIDLYNHPGEPGALPLTNLSHDEALTICDREDKRLCTELEWERACKGPSNWSYEYGDAFDASACGAGPSDALAPSGMTPRCVSAFGVFDMHGSASNWTASPWARGSQGVRYAVRGGGGGEVYGRCASGRGYAPDRRDARLGVRCCAGEPNAAEVELDVTRGTTLRWRPVDQPLAAALAAEAPEELRQPGPAMLPYRIERLWDWRPIGNEALLIGGGCARGSPNDACGLVIARPGGDGGALETLAFVTSDWWMPTVGEHETRSILLYGGDHAGAYRKPVVYDFGRIRDGEKFRKKRGEWQGPWGGD